MGAEKTLKKVQEGLEVFDDHQEQYDTTDPSNNNAREKLESQVGRPGPCDGFASRQPAADQRGCHPRASQRYNRSLPSP
jgi:hypothetical protein